MIHLEVIVQDVDALLDVQAYGAGALLRWESSATVDGVYVEGGTVALVSGTSLYDVWDAAGTTGTWYRTRTSDAGGTTFSDYSVPFQTAEYGLYLSLDQARTWGLGPGLADEVLLILLAAAEQEIVRYAGPSGEVTERFRANGDLLMLSARALSVSTIIENLVTLEADDYLVTTSGRTLRRLSTGTHPGYCWRGWVDVTYLPVDDLASRQRVQAELVKLAVTFSPGLASQTIGTWSESYRTDRPYAEQRAEVLATLSDGIGVY